ncbi:MAG TPA: hypothetical protein VFI73_04610 [Candidatus Nitrosopolaris sp.]|nr:hypothetical protein [Candidatus Nitrosopolaris sp.]
MRKKQIRWLYVTLAITFLSASILFMNNNQIQILLAQNNNNSTNNSNTATVKAATTTKNPYNVNNSMGNGAVTMKTTPALTSTNPANILESFMSPKAMLASTIDQIRNSTSRNDNNSNNETSAARNVTTFVRNSGILLLSHQIIPPKDFLPVYDAMPYKIMNGQVTAKLPCDSNSKPSLEILAGQLPQLKPAQPKLVPVLSHPGYMCMYYANLTSTNNDIATTNATSKVTKVDNITTSGGVGGGLTKGNLTITYVELFNPTDYRVVLPSTASLSISINQILPLEERQHTNGTTGLNQTTPTVNQTIPPTVNQTAIKNIPNNLTRTGISPTTAFVYNAWNPYLKQKTYLPVAPLINETILSNSKCAIHAIWQSPKEEQSDLTELKEYLIITNNNDGNAPMHLYMCGGAPIP